MLEKSKSFKQNKQVDYIINNSITLHDEIEDAKQGKGRAFTSKFLTQGIAHYKEFGDLLLTKEVIDKYLHTIIGCPVIINHKNITDKNVEKERVGIISDAYFNSADGYYYCKGIIWDKDAISLVKNQGWNVSCSYDFNSNWESKTHNGKKIDVEVESLNFLHLALVEVPRYERANIVVNSKEEETEIIDKKGNLIMSALNELENFVRGIVENACKKEEMKEEEMTVENKEVEIEEKEEKEPDYKKMYEELKEKFDALNKCDNADEEEKEEKFEEEKEIAENGEVEVEEEEIDEEKLDENEDKKAEKVENSMEIEEEEISSIDKAREIVYNGNNEIKSNFITKSDRLELGNNY